MAAAPAAAEVSGVPAEGTDERVLAGDVHRQAPARAGRLGPNICAGWRRCREGDADAASSSPMSMPSSECVGGDDAEQLAVGQPAARSRGAGCRIAGRDTGRWLASYRGQAIDAC